MAFDPINPGQNQNPAEPKLNIPPVPPPPSASPSEQEVRTMRADMAGAPAPAPVTNLPTFDAEEPAFTPETVNPNMSVDQMIAAGKPNHMWWLIGGIGGFVVLALVGFFVVYPLFNKSAEEATQPVVEQPAQPGQPQQPAQPAAPAHRSQFVNQPAGTMTQTLTVGANGSLSQAEIKGALVAAGTTAKLGMTEVIFKGSKGEAVMFSQVLLALGPELSQAGISSMMDEDGTVFIFKDANGVWPGYVSQFKSGIDSNAITKLSQQIEKIKLQNFFVVDPGTLGAFKSGTVNGTPDRYAPGSTAGASFGYLTAKNRLLISTSFEGMKEAMRLMGL